MRKIIAVILLAGIAYSSLAQAPDAEERKKLKIKKINSNNSIGEKDLVVDVNGQITAELHEGSSFLENEIAYNSYQKPDSIICTSEMSFLRCRQYFTYNADGSSTLLSIFADRADTIFTGKDNKKIRQQSSDGSKIKYEYNLKRQLIKEITTNKEGKTETAVLIYDVNGRLIKEILSSRPGTVLTTVYTYTANGKWLTKKSTGTGGYAASGSSSKYEYNAKGLLVKETAFIGTFDNSETYKYEFY